MKSIHKINFPLFIAIIMKASIRSGYALPSPQLNLPPLPILPSTRPDVSLNSYTPNQFYTDDDDNRSQRYGPPYQDGEDFRNRQGRKEDNSITSRDRYRYDDRDRNYYNSSYDRYTEDRNYNRYPADRNYDRNQDFDYNRGRDFDYNRGRNFDYNRDKNNYNYSSFSDRYPGDRNYDRPYFNRNSDQYRNERNRYSEDLQRIQAFLTDTDHKSSVECTVNVAAQWNFETNVNEITQSEALLAQHRYSDFQRLVWQQVKDLNKDEIFDDHIYRQIKLLSEIGPNALPPDQLDRYNRLINDMLAIYNGASICAYERPFDCGLRLQTDLKEIMARSRDWNELQHVWTEWRRKSGKPMRDLFEQLVDIVNDVANHNNFSDGGAFWFSGFEASNFREEMETVWSQIQPLYELMHSYVRRKLREYYGPDKINRNAPLPAHILGNMYSQSWTNILDIIIPYPGRSFLDVTPRMLEQGYTPLIMFQLAEEFFLSLNMSSLSPDFWINSVIEEPLNRPILCQPSAWDFCTRHDFRIKMCTRVTHKDLISVHHEMTHIQYFLNYRHQPKVFRDGANPGFHEAIGDAIGLSVSTPKHLQTLGLIQKSIDDTTYDINYLFALAADKVAFLPFALAMDLWRGDVYSKKIRREQYNCHYWYLRELYGGVKPPVLRSELDFDPGAKYHVAGNVPYIKYFFGSVLQFQIYRALCRVSRQYDPNDPRKPLHKCDIYRQPEAGNLLRRLMEKGASEPWQRVLEEMTGEGRLDGSALRDYFRPLEEWLRNENLRNQEFVGWSYDGDYCKYSLETANLQVFGGFYNAANETSATDFLTNLVIFLTFLRAWMTVN